MRRILSNLIISIGRWVGRQHAPFAVKKVTITHYYDVMDHIRTGDILLSYCRGWLTNWLIPGKWKHAAIYAGANKDKTKPFVVESVDRGVVITDLVSFMLRKDAVLVVRPSFASHVQRTVAAGLAMRKVGAPYDYEFTSNNKAFYCSELIFESYKAAVPGCPLELRTRLGRKTFTPSDIAAARDKFSVVWTMA